MLFALTLNVWTVLGAALGVIITLLAYIAWEVSKKK
jgi:hypothetical protein